VVDGVGELLVLGGGELVAAAAHAGVGAHDLGAGIHHVAHLGGREGAAENEARIMKDGIDGEGSARLGGEDLGCSSNGS